VDAEVGFLGTAGFFGVGMKGTPPGCPTPPVIYFDRRAEHLDDIP